MFSLIYRYLFGSSQPAPSPPPKKDEDKKEIGLDDEHSSHVTESFKIMRERLSGKDPALPHGVWFDIEEGELSMRLEVSDCQDRNSILKCDLGDKDEFSLGIKDEFSLGIRSSGITILSMNCSQNQLVEAVNAICKMIPEVGSTDVLFLALKREKVPVEESKDGAKTTETGDI